MNTIQLGKEFEKEAFNILKKRFDKVFWLSKNRHSSFDFKCIKDNQEYYGDAKLRNYNRRVNLTLNQKDADFIIAKVKGNIYFIFKKNFSKSPINIFIENSQKHFCKISQNTWRKMQQIKIDKDMRTFDDVLEYLFEKQKEVKRK